MSSSVGRNSLIMASGTLASRLTGQVRTILLAAAIGTTGMAANAYQAGSMIPQVVYTLVSGGIFNAVLVPQIVRTLKEKNAEERLNKLITFAITLLLIVTVLMAAATPLLTRLYVDGSSDMMALTNAFTLWCMPQIFFYGLYTVVGQILAALDHFGTYAWSSVGANVISCIGFTAFIVLFGRADQQPVDFWTTDKIALTAGAWTLGVAFQALILFVPLFRSGFRYKPSWGVRGIGLRSMGPVAAWSIGVVVVNQIANVVSTRVTTSAPTQANLLYGLSEFDVAGNATYQNAYTLFMLPYSLIAVSVSTAMFPRISQAIADHQIGEAREQLSSALRNVGLLMYFFTAAFLVIPVPITLALLPSVSVKEAILISGPLMGLGCGLPLTAAYLIIQRTFYAFEDGKHPFIFAALSSGIQICIVIIGSRLVAPQYWVTLLGIAIPMGNLLSFPVLIGMLRKRFDGHIDGRRLAGTYGKGLLATVVTVVVGLLTIRPIYSLVGAELTGDGGTMNWAQALGTCVLSAIILIVVYAGMLWLLRAEELTSLIALAKSMPGRIRGDHGGDHGNGHGDDRGDNRGGSRANGLGGNHDNDRGGSRGDSRGSNHDNGQKDSRMSSRDDSHGSDRDAADGSVTGSAHGSASGLATGLDNGSATGSVGVSSGGSDGVSTDGSTGDADGEGVGGDDGVDTNGDGANELQAANANTRAATGATGATNVANVDGMAGMASVAGVAVHAASALADINPEHTFATSEFTTKADLASNAVIDVTSNIAADGKVAANRTNEATGDITSEGLASQDRVASDDAASDAARTASATPLNAKERLPLTQPPADQPTGNPPVNEVVTSDAVDGNAAANDTGSPNAAVPPSFPPSIAPAADAVAARMADTVAVRHGGIDAASSAGSHHETTTSPTDRITTASQSQSAFLHMGVERDMKPQLGDTVLNRYVLVSSLRQERGLQVWKANDRVLARDCQLFIVNDAAALPSVNATASTLVVARDTHCTRVLQLKHHGSVAVIITQLDAGLSLAEYLSGPAHDVLTYDAIRSIVGAAVDASIGMHQKMLYHQAISLDTIRISTGGIQFADTPISSMLADPVALPANLSRERRTICQLAMVLYALLTRTKPTPDMVPDLNALPADTPTEFRMICNRGLYQADNAHLPMESLSEFSALLGEWKPLHQLNEHDIALPGTDGECSIVTAPLKPTADKDVISLPGDIVTTSLTPDFSFSLSSSTSDDYSDANAGNARLAAVAAGAAAAAGAAGMAAGTANAANVANAVGTAGATAGNAAASVNGAAAVAGMAGGSAGNHDPHEHRPLKSLWNKSKEMLSEGIDDGHYDDADQPDLFDPFDDQQSMPDDSHNTVPINVASVRTGTGTGEDDSDNPFEKTSPIPIINDDGTVVAPGSESQRALEEEQAAIEAAERAGTAVTPPSFSPGAEPENAAAAAESTSVADQSLLGRLTTKTVAIIAVIVLVVAALGIAVYSLTNDDDQSSQGVTQTEDEAWPEIDLDSVPFGESDTDDTTDDTATDDTAETDTNDDASDTADSDSDDDADSTDDADSDTDAEDEDTTDEEEEPREVVTADKEASAVPTPIHTNTTPYQISSQTFLQSPGGQDGFAYVIRLSEAEDVYRMTISITTSGGQGYILVGTTNDPTAGEQVAQFEFAEGGTTTVTFDEVVNTDTVMLWIPRDDLPGGQIYVNQIQLS